MTAISKHQYTDFFTIALRNVCDSKTDLIPFASVHPAKDAYFGTRPFSPCLGDIFSGYF